MYPELILCCLDGQERLDRSEAYFADPETLASYLEDLFSQVGLCEMLSDLSGSSPVEAIKQRLLTVS